jgi:DNA-binding protein HU-beta
MAGKANIVDYVVSNVDGVTRKQVTEVFEAIMDATSDFLKDDERVQFPGFGSFSVSDRPARKGRNPKTGETITIKASKNVRFKAGKELKDSLNG